MTESDSHCKLTVLATAEVPGWEVHMATGTFYRDADGEIYCRTPVGWTYHVWPMEPVGYEFDEAPIPPGAGPAGDLADEERSAILAAVGDYEAEEIPFREQHGDGAA